ncbi:MAG: putative DNA binding domain-containing protein [Gammaproteobacteria bacterium]|nr:putative DNA binding domain-containing protein [Gammaproteobacteria bacterium]
MEWVQVLERIQAGEDDHTEFKRFRSFGERDWQDSVCAFANTDGGLIVLGIANDGAIEGVPMDSDDVQERLTSALQTALSAPVQARIGRHQDPKGWVHWIEVVRMRGPEPLRNRGRVLVRRGRASVEPGSTEIQELYNTFGLVFTEERIIPGTGSDDVEASVFRRFMERKGVNIAADSILPFETDLLNREVLDRDLDGSLRLTLYGLMCFGKDPQGHAPTKSLWVDLVAYAGCNRGDSVLLSGEAKGRLNEQVERAEAWLRTLGRQERYLGMRRADEWLVPLRAFRECIVNAVAHRDYTILGSKVLVEVFDDRVVVTSPGALPNHKRPESVLAGGAPRSRNEAMANFLLDLGFMEQRGSGYPRIIREMSAFNGTLPLLENEKDERWVRVTLWREPQP